MYKQDISVFPPKSHLVRERRTTDLRPSSTRRFEAISARRPRRYSTRKPAKKPKMRRWRKKRLERNARCGEPTWKQADLDAAYAAWTSKSNEFACGILSYRRGRQGKSCCTAAEAGRRSAKLKTSVADAQARLSAANNERSSRLQVDEAVLGSERAECDNRIADAHLDLDNATRD